MSWYPGATRQDGPVDKYGYGSQREGPKEGIVFHSMEGTLAGSLGELMRPDRRASWTFSNPKSGPLLQHYPVEAHTWASSGPGGTAEPNIRFTSIEHEGRAGEPLTPSQIENDIALLRWLRDYFGWPGLERHQQLLEHKEMIAFGGVPTACPSGRIPWETILAALEEVGMTLNIPLVRRENDDEVYADLETALVHIPDAKYVADWPSVRVVAGDDPVFNKPTFYPLRDRVLP